jgi:uncharacterized protein YcfJ
MQCKEAIMSIHRTICTMIIGSLALGSLPACRDIPAEEETQGAVIGGVTGAVAGAVIAGEGNRMLGALLGGALGAAGGYIIGAEVEKVREKDRDDALEASRASRRNPATAEDVARANTADLNQDGFVTLDEVVAMKQAGLNDDQMIQRLRATNHIFEFNHEQEQFLLDNGVSLRVVSEMRRINQQEKERVLSDVGRKMEEEPERKRDYDRD